MIQDPALSERVCVCNVCNGERQDAGSDLLIFQVVRISFSALGSWSQNFGQNVSLFFASRIQCRRSEMLIRSSQQRKYVR